MGLINSARAKSLSWTGSIGYTSPLTSIQSYDWNRTQEKAAFLHDTARVNSHYRGINDAYITVTTADMAFLAACSPGERVTAVVLTVEAAIDSNDATAPTATDLTVTLSHAIIDEVSPITGDNASSMPVTGSVTFRLSRPVGASTDPTITVA